MTGKLGAHYEAEGQNIRCECGQLIAKLQQEGIELKCKRCKRIVLIAFASIEGWAVPSPSVGSYNKKASATAP